MEYCREVDNLGRVYILRKSGRNNFPSGMTRWVFFQPSFHKMCRTTTMKRKEAEIAWRSFLSSAKNRKRAWKPRTSNFTCAITTGKTKALGCHVISSSFLPDSWKTASGNSTPNAFTIIGRIHLLLLCLYHHDALLLGLISPWFFPVDHAFYIKDRFRVLKHWIASTRRKWWMALLFLGFWFISWGYRTSLHLSSIITACFGWCRGWAVLCWMCPLFLSRNFVIRKQAK